MKFSAFNSTLLLAIGLGLGMAAQASPVQVTLDPGTAGLAGGSFAADALTGGEVSRISNQPPALDGSFSWHEVGYLHITGTMLNGNPVVPTGLDSAYSMYIAFDIHGFQPPGFGPGYSTSATMSLYGANGVSSFGFDGGNNAFVNNASAPVLLATTSNIAIQTSANVVSFSPLALDLSATVQANYHPAVPGFSSPAGTLGLDGSFLHPSAGVQVLFGGGAFLVTGGTDVLSFTTPVPEPASAALLLAGLAVVGAGLRRRAT
jgi:hypothetical protein